MNRPSRPKRPSGSRPKTGDETATAAEPPSSGPTIVGIGASAGGLAALKRFFRDVPADAGVAFVVVVHLSPEHESRLAEVLQPFVRMPVAQVSDSVPLEPDHVYLIPPNANLNAIDTHLRLSKLEERRRERAPVDHFFRTLARTHDGHSVGIILTGTGSDGALGVKAIKERGGLTVVQAPADAEYDGMPQSAIATGLVDLILPLAEIPAAVLRYARTKPKIDIPEEERPAEGSTQLLQKIFAQIRARTGRDFGRYKRSTILRRVSRRMQLRQVEELSDYLELLRSEPAEVTALSDDMLITVTAFFRDPEVFAKLEQEVIPALFAEKGGDDDVRVWNVGCASGEEAYSFAMLLLEESARRENAPRIQIFASDLHDHSLRRAREGFYPGDIATDVSEERLRRFFHKEDGGYRIRKEVREIVVFAPHNLLGDPPFSRLDLIACRNLLIYLQRDVQQDVAEIFHYALRPNGFLVLGSSEAVDRPDLFSTDDKKLCVYRRRDTPTPEPRLPVFPSAPMSLAARESVGGGPARTDRASYAELHLRLVERHAPPSLLVSPDDRLVHLSPNAGRYLLHPTGELTSSFLKLVREELRFDLRALLSEARRGRPASSKPIPVALDGAPRPVVMHARPTPEPRQDGFVFVWFEEASESTGAERSEAPAVAPASADADARQRDLEQELELARQRLQAIIEEYETSQEEMKATNEELQSANEELRSTLEELETSKEELQSMNEELQTVNQENRHKVEELAQLSGDLQNFLAATDIATLFLDRELRIMRFTPAIGDLYNIRSTDQGRPISDLTRRLGYPELEQDAATVLARLTPIEREVRDEAKRWYLTRVLPYRSASDRIEGVVLTFVDITRRKEAEEALRQSQQQLRDELDAMIRLHDLVARLLVSTDLNAAVSEVLEATISMTGARMGSIHLADPESGALRMEANHGIDPSSVSHFDAVSSRDPTPAGRAFATGTRIVVEDVSREATYARLRDDAAAAGYHGAQSTPLVSRSGEILGVLSTQFADAYHPSERDLRMLDLYARQASDFIERVRNEGLLREKSTALEAENERKKYFLAMLGHELRNPLAALDSAMRVVESGVEDSGEVHALMATQVHQLTMLVNDLLELSRVDHGTITLRKGRTDLARVIRAAAEAAARAVRGKEQEVSLALESPLFVSGDETRLEQVVTNLLGNASKYTPRRGKIEVTLRREGNRAMIEVRDEGRGLESSELERIFQPFVRGDASDGGLGIGLALARGLVSLHQGTIEAHSAGPGRGSVFTVRLPIGEVPESDDAAPRIDGAGRQLPAATRVLIVDDNHDTADALALLLRLRGADTLCAYDGADALAKAREWKPEVAVVDIGLPDMTGYEVAARLRKQPGSERLFLLAATGYGDPGVQKKAIASGFDEHMVKPLDDERLSVLLARQAERADPPLPVGEGPAAKPTAEGET